jgi:hypothetical protein
MMLRYYTEHDEEIYILYVCMFSDEIEKFERKQRTPESLLLRWKENHVIIPVTILLKFSLRSPYILFDV